MQTELEINNMACPVPNSRYDSVMMAHGGGGKLSQQLIQQVFYKSFSNKELLVGHDGALLELNGVRLAFSTDSYVVQPIFFPGGNIGELAIYGTVNDLACCGAIPEYISAGFIIEEGFPVEELEIIAQSMKKAAEIAGVQIVTGDTKVVEKGKADRIFINTSGIGAIPAGRSIAPQNAKPGDIILINGTIADHGIAIMSSRAGLEFETTIHSDCCALNGLAEAIFKVSDKVYVMRDPTRGGVASALNEIAQSAGYGILIEENKIPVRDEVAAACELLGFDPLYVANEGKLLVFIDEQDAEKVLEAMKNHPAGRDSAIIGSVTSDYAGKVRMKTLLGSHRYIEMISGEQLPRIC
ncbi:MAG: hydrogenase expression/formation protein HypE [Bacteroidales bacterium]